MSKDVSYYLVTLKQASNRLSQEFRDSRYSSAWVEYYRIKNALEYVSEALDDISPRHVAKVEKTRHVLPRNIGIGILVCICLLLWAGLSGCSTTAKQSTEKLSNFKATCVILPIGQNEQGMVVIKQYCELE